MRKFAFILHEIYAFTRSMRATVSPALCYRTPRLSTARTQQLRSTMSSSNFFRAPQPSSSTACRKPILAEQAEQLRRLNAQHPDLTAGEIRQRLGLRVSVLTVWRMLRRLGLTFKKVHSCQ